jgi:hypothetical protein
MSTKLVAFGIHMVSAAVTLILLATSIDPESRRLACIIYAACCLIALLAAPTVSAGMNLAVAVALSTHLLLDWMQGKSINTGVTKRTSVVLFDGTAHSTALQGKTYSPAGSGDSKRSFPRSLNAIGGAEMTYTMWFMVERIPKKECIVFLHGDKNVFSASVNGKTGSVWLSYCPAVTISRNKKNLVVIRVHVNMSDRVDHVFTIGGDANDGLNLIQGHHVMLSFVLRDNMSRMARTASTRLLFYINDQRFPVSPIGCPASLRVNEGGIHLFPDMASKKDDDKVKMKVSDFTYHNYALNETQIDRLFRRGPNKKDISAVLLDLGGGDDLSLGNRIRAGDMHV